MLVGKVAIGNDCFKTVFNKEFSYLTANYRKTDCDNLLHKTCLRN